MSFTMSSCNKKVEEFVNRVSLLRFSTFKYVNYKVGAFILRENKMRTIFLLLSLSLLVSCSDLQSTAQPAVAPANEVDVTTTTATPAVPDSTTTSAPATTEPSPQAPHAPGKESEPESANPPEEAQEFKEEDLLAVAKAISYGFAKPGDAPKFVPEYYPDLPTRPARKISAAEVAHLKGKGSYGPLLDYARKGMAANSAKKVEASAGAKSDSLRAGAIKPSPMELLQILSQQQQQQQNNPGIRQVEEAKTEAPKPEPQMPVGDAMDQLKQKSYKIEPVTTEPNAVVITPPKNDTPSSPPTITPTTKRPAVDPPTMIVNHSYLFPKMLPGLTASPKMLPVVDTTDMEPHCPSLAQLMASGAEVWTGVTQAEGFKEGFGVLYDAATNALSTIAQCAKRLMESIGNLLFSKESGQKKNETSTVTGPNIRTHAGRREYHGGAHHVRSRRGNDTVVIISSDANDEIRQVRQGEEKIGLLNEAKSNSGEKMTLREKLKYSRAAAAAPEQGKLEDDLIAEVENDEPVAETGKRMDIVDPVLYSEK